MKKCNKCKFSGCLNDGSPKFVPGKGNLSSDIMVIADYPDKLGSYLHEPFMDEAAAAIDFFMYEAGLIPRSVSKHKILGNYKKNDKRYKNIYYTTALKCFPSLGKDLTAANISRIERNACRNEHLYKEIRAVKPKYILTIGNESLKMVRNDHKANAQNARGFWEYNKEFDCHIFPIPTHFAITSAWEVTSAIAREIKQFSRDIKNGIPNYKLGHNYGCLTKIKSVKKFFKFLNTKKRISFDFETSSLRHWDPSEEALGISFCWKKGCARYIPFVGQDRKEIWSFEHRQAIWEMLKDFFENEAVKKDGQNMKFDINWLHHHGIHHGKGFDWDTMQFHHLIDENTPNNLTYLTCYYNLNFPHYDQEIIPYVRYKGVEKEKTKEKDYSGIPLPIISKYGCADVDAVWQIRTIQQKYATEKQKKLYYNISVPLSIVSSSMERKGVRINIEEIDKLEGEYQKKINKKKEILSKYVNEDNFNCNSNPQMQKLLFDKLGLYTPFKTKSGKPSTDAKSFELMGRKQGKKRIDVGNSKKLVVQTLFNKVIELRTMIKMKSTYLTGMRLLADKDSRVHTSYMTAVAVTSRLASRNPNLQNIPNDPVFRSLFVAGPGRYLIPADYSQIEARILPFIAREIPYILKFQEKGFDPHTYNSSIIRKKPEKEVTSDERKKDKGVTFGINYGRSAKSIADEYEMPVKEVQDIMDAFFAGNPAITKWRDNREAEAKNELPSCKDRKDFYVENPLGRRRHFSIYKWIYQPEIQAVSSLRSIQSEEEVSDNYRINGLIGGAERQAVNFPVQSYAAELLTLATYRVYKRCKLEMLDSHLVLTVHDMLALDTHKTQADKALKILNEEMPVTKSFTHKGKKISINFPIDAEITQHWVQ